MSEDAAFLKALTPEAQASLGTSLFQIRNYPFRIGRESRIPTNTVFPNSRRGPDSSPNNDLFLADGDGPLNVSREHFQIERHNGAFFLVDRNSTCGTLVEGETIGKGRNGGRRQLKNGDVIIVGTSASKQVIKFVTKTGREDR